MAMPEDEKNVIGGIQIEFDDGSNKVWYRSSTVNNGNWTVGKKGVDRGDGQVADSHFSNEPILMEILPWKD